MSSIQNVQKKINTTAKSFYNQKKQEINQQQNQLKIETNKLSTNMFKKNKKKLSNSPSLNTKLNTQSLTINNSYNSNNNIRSRNSNSSLNEELDSINIPSNNVQLSNSNLRIYKNLNNNKKESFKRMVLNMENINNNNLKYVITNNENKQQDLKALQNYVKTQMSILSEINRITQKEKENLDNNLKKINNIKKNIINKQEKLKSISPSIFKQATFGLFKSSNNMKKNELKEKILKLEKNLNSLSIKKNNSTEKLQSSVKFTNKNKEVLSKEIKDKIKTIKSIISENKLKKQANGVNDNNNFTVSL